jgi:hypothetical protein
MRACSTRSILSTSGVWRVDRTNRERNGCRLDCPERVAFGWRGGTALNEREEPRGCIQTRCLTRPCAFSSRRTSVISPAGRLRGERVAHPGRIAKHAPCTCGQPRSRACRATRPDGARVPRQHHRRVSAQPSAEFGRRRAVLPLRAADGRSVVRRRNRRVRSLTDSPQGGVGRVVPAHAVRARAGRCGG